MVSQPGFRGKIKKIKKQTVVLLVGSQTRVDTCRIGEKNYLKKKKKFFDFLIKSRDFFFYLL